MILPSYNTVILHSYVQLAEGILLFHKYVIMVFVIWNYIGNILHISNRLNNPNKETQEDFQYL